MYLRLLRLKPRWFGNAVRSSPETRAMTFVPHFSSCCRARIVRPMSQYIWSISVLTLSWARTWAPRTMDLSSSINSKKPGGSSDAWPGTTAFAGMSFFMAYTFPALAHAVTFLRTYVPHTGDVRRSARFTPC